ncbi:hypothetical protein F3J24_21535 [Comamonas sp. Tr-654]|uniref:A24 family peptidase n=1 Tax=Comamonas sp. Tr-654 TaxID=2608341 RepID=UPI0014211ECE|nr:prepilin peptidase [Comamonas sp. Tr-654]NIF86064.1 hypothetical protein [Comamonas sp. Tr-654]
MATTLTLAHLVLTPALACVVVSDLLYRRIANRLLLVLLTFWLLCTCIQLFQGNLDLASLAIGAGIALAVLIAGYLLFAIHWMGAGDAKLMAVLCLWMADQSLLFMMVTALVGGLLALMLPLVLAIERGIAWALMHIDGWLPRPTVPLPHALREQPLPGIPYGLAIAAGALLVLWGSV